VAVPPAQLSRISGDLVRSIVEQPIFKSFTTDGGELSFKSAAVYDTPWWEECGIDYMTRFVQDPDNNILGSTVAYPPKERDPSAYVLQTSYVHGDSAVKWANLVNYHTDDEMNTIIQTELQHAFQDCDAINGATIKIPEPIDYAFACWACDGTGWGVSHTALVNEATNAAFTQLDVQEWAKAPISSLKGQVALVGADYSPDTGFSQGALASAKCLGYHWYGIPVGNETYWEESFYCNLE
jgi:hypothetical protein